MIGYAMVGASDLKRSTDFYDALLAPLGLEKVELDMVYTAYAPKITPGDIEFYVTKPFDQNAATAGNGSMVAFKVDRRRCVDLFHQIGLENQGLDEGAPGLRPADGTVYYAYVRDPDGNKICAYCEGLT
jgi:catechol 2,3-dioxygenase-like lactoylglutathione lyase family enzyme